MRRVTRLIIYTGDDVTVERQLGQSLPDGLRECSKNLTIRVLTIDEHVVDNLVAMAEQEAYLAIGEAQ